MSDDIRKAEKEAALAAAFHAALIHANQPEPVALQLTVAYILARQRRARPEPWEIDE